MGRLLYRPGRVVIPLPRPTKAGFARLKTENLFYDTVRIAKWSKHVSEAQNDISDTSDETVSLSYSTQI